MYDRHHHSTFYDGENLHSNSYISIFSGSPIIRRSSRNAVSKNDDHGLPVTIDYRGVFNSHLLAVSATCYLVIQYTRSLQVTADVLGQSFWIALLRGGTKML